MRADFGCVHGIPRPGGASRRIYKVGTAWPQTSVRHQTHVAAERDAPGPRPRGWVAAQPRKKTAQVVSLAQAAQPARDGREAIDFSTDETLHIGPDESGMKGVAGARDGVLCTLSAQAHAVHRRFGISENRLHVDA